MKQTVHQECFMPIVRLKNIVERVQYTEGNKYKNDTWIPILLPVS